MSHNNGPLLAAALSAMTRTNIITHEDYRQREGLFEYGGTTFQPLSIDDLHQSYLIGPNLAKNTGTSSFTSSLKKCLRRSSATSTPLVYPNNFRIHVRTLTGKTIDLVVTSTTTVHELKQQLQIQQGIPADQQRLIFDGRTLEDHHAIDDYKIQGNAIIYFILKTNSTYKQPKYISYIHLSHLHPEFDFDFTNIVDGKPFKRGKFLYQRPCGWNRIALRVLNMYGVDNRWLGEAPTENFRESSSTGEWPVSYHGTGKSNGLSLADDGFVVAKSAKFVNENGIYSTPDINVAARYAQRFEYLGELYQVVIQNRVNPKNLTRVTDDFSGSEYWISSKGTDIRPYGVCIRKEQSNRIPKLTDNRKN